MIGLALGALALARAPSVARAEDALQVEVRGEPLRRAEDPTSASTSLGEESLGLPGESLATALARVPGVQVARTGSGSELATLTLRGASSAQTPVYLAGVRLNDELYRAADLSTVPSFFLRRADVYRGHAPIHLDRTGLGGAVLLEPDVPTIPSASAGVGAGSFGERAAFGVLTVGARPASVALAVRAERSRGDFSFVDDRGTRFDPSDDREVVHQNADASSIDAWGVLRVALGGRGTWSTVVNTFSREQGVPGLGVVPASEARAKTSRALLSSRVSVRCGQDREDACTVGASTFAKRTRYELSDPHRELPFGTTRQLVTATSVGGALAFTDDLTDWLEGTVGAGQALEGLATDPDGPGESHARRFSARAFGELVFRPVHRLEVRAAAAVASERTDAAGPSQLLLAPTGRVGVAADPTDWLTFFTTGAYYTRAPSLGELYGASASFLGNATLEPERGPSFDVGARAHARHERAVDFGAEVVLFARLADDLIEYRRSAAGTVRPYNVGSARFLGGEALAGATFADLVRVQSSLSLTDPRDVTEGRGLTNDVLPFYARLVTGHEASLLLADLGPDEWITAAELGAAFLFRSRRVADPAGLVALPSQALLDASLGVTLARGMLRGRARATNLLGDVTTDLVGYPLPGRAGHLEIEGSWP